jgi:hypothetical protein
MENILMFIYQGGYKVEYHYFRNTCIIYETEKPKCVETKSFEPLSTWFKDSKEIGRKWWAPVAPLLDYAVIIWKAKGNLFQIFGYPNFYKFNYADFYEHGSRMSFIIYQSLLHYKKQIDTGNHMCEISDKFRKGLDSAIFAFWYHSGMKNPDGKYFFDIHGFDFKYSDECQKKLKAGRRWYCDAIPSMWD